MILKIQDRSLPKSIILTSSRPPIYFFKLKFFWYQKKINNYRRQSIKTFEISNDLPLDRPRNTEITFPQLSLLGIYLIWQIHHQCHKQITFATIISDRHAFPRNSNHISRLTGPGFADSDLSAIQACDRSIHA